MSKILIIILLSFLSCGCIPARPGVNQAGKISSPASSHLELPAVRQGEVIISHHGYSASFNSSYLIPNWVAYELTAEETLGTVRRPSNSPFTQDPSYKGQQPDRSDYSRSGWDKGHLAPCADMKWSEEAMIESFYFTNICPQDHSFNERDWQKLENLGRDIAKSKGSVYIVCGPVVADNEYGKLGQNQVVIPDAFFKAFLYKDASGFHSIAFLMPNKFTGLPIKEYSMSVNQLENLIGFDLFSRLNDKVEETVESQNIISDWAF